MDKRKAKRYPVFLRVYFPDSDSWGYAVDVSSEGCHLQMEHPMPTGFVTDFLIELPVIGVIPFKGYVHHADMDMKEMGLELVNVKFDNEQSDYYSIYQQFIRQLEGLDEIREHYESLVTRRIIKIHDFPRAYSLENLKKMRVKGK